VIVLNDHDQACRIISLLPTALEFCAAASGAVERHISAAARAKSLILVDMIVY
jgi:hypothetical protein